MTSFLTQCPHCLTSFRITDKQVDAAEGMVRCGACLGIFSAPSNRIQMREQLDPEQLAAQDAAARAEEEAHHAAPGTGLRTPVVADPAAPLVDPATRLPLASEAAHDRSAAAAVHEESADVHASDDGMQRNYDIPLGNLALDEIYADARQEADDEDSIDWFADDEDDGNDWIAGTNDDPDNDDSDDDWYDDEPTAEDEALGTAIYEADDDDSLLSARAEIASKVAGREEAAGWSSEDEEDADTWLELDLDEFEDSLVADADSGNRRLELDAVGPAVDTDGADDWPDDEDSDDSPMDREDDELDEDEFDEEDDDQYDEEDEDEEDEEDEDDEDDDEDWLEDEDETAFSAGLPADKRRYQQYLSDLDDDEALEPLSRRALDGIAPEPLLLGTGRRRSRWLTVSLVGLNLVLALLLALQYAAANIVTLSSSPSLAPVLPQLCRVLTCPAPSRSDLASLRSQELLVRAHPRYAEALEVSIIFRNDADRAQPFPALELGFTDRNNRQHSNRLFQPAEYLPLELRELSEMPARSSVQVLLELSDPGSATANYTLAFREP